MEWGEESKCASLTTRAHEAASQLERRKNAVTVSLLADAEVPSTLPTSVRSNRAAALGREQPESMRGRFVFSGVLGLVSVLGMSCSDADTGTPMGGAGMGGAGMGGSACTAKPGAIRGRSTQMLTAAGLARSFVYYAPHTLDPSKPAPVVIIPHGYTMNADMMFEITGYSALADREGFIAIFPNGQQPGIGTPWNVGTPDCSSTLGFLPLARGDDNAFIDAMLQFAENDQCLDRQHVFMTGFSMGGYFSNETGCMREDIRAIGPHSGGSHDFATCNVTNKPVIVMHFEGDGLIPYGCGTQARDRWLALNVGCQLDQPTTTAIQGGRCEYYAGCPADGQVAMCSFTIPSTGTRNEAFPGHGWSGGSKQGSANGAAFAIPETASATELSWSFFQQYAW
jgi:polyhydroxybutyrate depolymerase